MPVGGTALADYTRGLALVVVGVAQFRVQQDHREFKRLSEYLFKQRLGSPGIALG